MLAVFLRLLALFLLIRYVLRLLGSFLRAAPRSSAPPRAPAAPARDLVRDRICNTFVPRDRALTAIVGGQEEHFCSPACRDQALRLAPRATA